MAHPDHIGNYKIVDELARGGQGIVYRAYHSTLKTPVALKVLLDPDPLNIKRFNQEARVLNKIKHPNLLQVIDYGEYEANNRAYPYMAMEFINGTDLSAILKRGIPETKWTIKVISTIGEVLNHLHEAGIVHRDLKPSNILIEKETNRPVLIDFGLVKRDPKKLGFETLDRSRLSQSGEITGTPNYMSPEQVDSKFREVGPWTDVYGLAATLYHLLTGELPYKGNAIGIFSRLMDLSTSSPDPRTEDPELPDYLAEAIMAAMQKDASLRPQDMRSFIASIQPPQPRVRPRGIRRFSKKGIYPALIGSGFAGLVAYFMAQGVPRFYAEKLAEQKTQSGTSPLASPSPTAINDPTVIRQAESLFRKEDYKGCIDFCSRVLKNTPNFYELRVLQGMAYYSLADAHKDNKDEAKELATRAEADLEAALHMGEPEKLFNKDYSRTSVIKLKAEVTKFRELMEFLQNRSQTQAFEALLDQTAQKHHDKDYIGCIKLATEGIAKYRLEPRTHELYGIRASSYYNIAIDLESKLLDAKEYWSKCKKDAERALELTPSDSKYDTYRKSLNTFIDKATKATNHRSRKYSRYNRRKY